MSLEPRVHLLVTRPEHSAMMLAEKVRAMGGRATVFPAMMICPQPEVFQQQFIYELKKATLVLFTSQNAAYNLSPQLKTILINRQRVAPKTLYIISMGVSTTKALQSIGLQVIYTAPLGAVSETLLASPWLHTDFVRNKYCVLLTGKGGRNILQNTLASRGAIVCKCEIYHRERPQVKGHIVLKKWQMSGVNVILVTSQNSLDNLLILVGRTGRDWLQSKQLLVISQRLAVYARTVGFDNILLAACGRDDAVIKALGSIQKEFF